MSTNSSNNSSDDEESHDDSSEEEGEEEEPLTEADLDLLDAVSRNDTAGVQHALRNGANVNSVCETYYRTPLMEACRHGYDDIVRILLDAGADARWSINRYNSVMFAAISYGHLTIVEILLNHDNDLLEIENKNGETPLSFSIWTEHFEIAHFLLDRGANALVTTRAGKTTLHHACSHWADLEIVRRLLAAGVDVEYGDAYHLTSLHCATLHGNIETMRELIVEHNANICAVDENEETPFDLVSMRRSSVGDRHALLIECYGNKLIQEHGRLALHVILGTADDSFAEARGFHPYQKSLRIHLPLGELTMDHFRALIHSLSPELIRNTDDTGKLPIHIACQSNAPDEVLSMLVEMDPATLEIADHTGALPIHSLCGSGTPVEYASVRYLLEQGGVGALAARNRDGALPLHVFCESTHPSLQTLQYLIQAFPESVTVQTNAGLYPCMIAASATSTAPLSVVYELVRANPRLFG